MTLKECNQLWLKYKQKNNVVSDALISDVLYDAPEKIEASFDLMEMLGGKFVLHLSKKFPLYRGAFCRFVLDHEFTHLADFLNYPYEKPAIADLRRRELEEANINTAANKNIFGKYGKINLPGKESEEDPLKTDIGKKLFDYMNTYSEFHACRTALKSLLSGRQEGRFYDTERNFIPWQFRDISMRKFMSDCLRTASAAYQQFRVMMLPQIFVVYFRQIMYLFGYMSHFGNDRQMLQSSFDLLNVCEQTEDYFILYDALKRGEIDRILEYTNRIYQTSYVSFVKTYIRTNYDPDLYTEEELDRITPDNYDDFAETLANRKGGRIWSGRVSPVFGVNKVGKAYAGVDPDTVRDIVKRTHHQAKQDF